MEDNKKEISSTTKWLMLGVAIFFDVVSLLSLIPVAGWILGFFVWLFAFMTFWTWFMMYDINIIGFKNPKKLVGTAIGSIIEMTPLGFIPAWTFLMLYLTRVEKIINQVANQVPGGTQIIKTVGGPTNSNHQQKAA